LFVVWIVDFGTDVKSDKTNDDKQQTSLISTKEEVTGVHIHTVTDRNVLQKSVLEKKSGTSCKDTIPEEVSGSQSRTTEVRVLWGAMPCWLLCRVGCYAMLAAMPRWLLCHVGCYAVIGCYAALAAMPCWLL
jgi:hypothetical protein